MKLDHQLSHCIGGIVLPIFFSLSWWIKFSSSWDSDKNDKDIRKTFWNNISFYTQAQASLAVRVALSSL